MCAVEKPFNAVSLSWCRARLEVSFRPGQRSIWEQLASVWNRKPDQTLHHNKTSARFRAPPCDGPTAPAAHVHTSSCVCSSVCVFICVCVFWKTGQTVLWLVYCRAAVPPCFTTLDFIKIRRALLAHDRLQHTTTTCNKQSEGKRLNNVCFLFPVMSRHVAVN